jgi:NAD-dependent oxidoreductase involved in siderophore biosynthesis
VAGQSAYGVSLVLSLMSLKMRQPHDPDPAAMSMQRLLNASKGNEPNGYILLVPSHGTP